MVLINQLMINSSTDHLTVKSFTEVSLKGHNGPSWWQHRVVLDSLKTILSWSKSQKCYWSQLRWRTCFNWPDSKGVGGWEAGGGLCRSKSGSFHLVCLHPVKAKKKQHQGLQGKLSFPHRKKDRIKINIYTNQSTYLCFWIYRRWSTKTD